MITRVAMTRTDMAHQRNRLLDSLEFDDLTAVRPHLIYVELGGGDCLTSLSGDEAVVCFPTTLVASIVQVMADGSRFEIGLIGSEGMTGWSAVLGGANVPQTGIAKIGGGGALIAPVTVVAELCRHSVTLHAALMASVQSFAVQMSHTIVANLRDGVERRLARWLLMLHDRVEGDMLAVTHGELASALHVRRASITDTLHVLEGERAVRCTRGQLVVRDRAALRAVAGDSYGPAEASYGPAIGAFGKG